MVLGSAARMRRRVRESRRPTSPDGRMTLVEHLRELRHRIIVSAIAIILGMIVAFIFHTQLLHLLDRPYCRLPPKLRAFDDGRCHLFAFGVTEGFTVTVKLCLWSGLLLASPVWLWQIWRFVTPGLYRHERRWATGFVTASVGLFALGGLFAWLALTRGLHFLLGFANGGGLTTLLTFSSYLSFVIAMVVVFAVSFEFPLAVVMLNFAGVLSFTRLRKWSRGILFAIFVFAGGATPSGDPITMLALAVPMCLLYGAALGIAFVHDRREERRAANSPYAGLSDDEASPLDDPDPVDPVESSVS
jgi:sec-independent protein translocase protein TatC